MKKIRSEIQSNTWKIFNPKLFLASWINLAKFAGSFRRSLLDRSGNAYGIDLARCAGTIQKVTKFAGLIWQHFKLD
jgi:hypothetical protein